MKTMEIDESTSLSTKPKSRKKTIVVVAVCCGVAAVVALAVGLGVGLSQGGGSSDVPVSSDPSTYPYRIDCYPEDKWGATKVTKEACEARGCTYDPPIEGSPAPTCFVGGNSALGSGYKALNDTGDARGSRKIILKSSTSTSSVSARTLEKSDAVFELKYGGENILHFRIYPQGVRYEIPQNIINIALPGLRPGVQPSYIFNVTSQDPFTFQILRRSSRTVLWDTGVGGTSVSDQFLTISTRLPSINIYGFGENAHHTFRHNLSYLTWPLFARDQWVGKGPHNNYGVHPFYTCLEEDGNSHGVLLLNSNAMDYSFTPLPMLTYRTIGGILDFYFFMGPSPENVVQQYTGLIGRPYTPPYWALGFQLCRYGYNTIDKMQDAVNRTKAAGIPQDIQYADIDHMNESMIFTVDNVNFAGLSEYFSSLREGGMRTIIILDPCIITNVSDYEPFKLGMEHDIFIKWPSRSMMPPGDYEVTNSTSILGKVWPKGKVVFPDFFLPQTEEVWTTLIQKHFKVLPFDGLWIDMNEPANFGTNEERPWNWPENDRPYWSLKCPNSSLDDPPYRTMATYVYDGDAIAAGRAAAKLSDKTLCMVAVQGINGTYRHYDVHNLYGATQALPTLNALRAANPGQRGIVVGRSTFPGAGRYLGHWLGDNFSEWPQMRESIIGMLEFNLFGFPYIGADICGFFGDTTAELCKRWMQLGAFYPYARNHNQIDSIIEQDPANFNEEVTRLSREALLIRYHLLPYLYTLHHLAHTEGKTVVRPLHHEFPKDPETWGIDQQFLWGSGLMIVPILYEGQTSLKYYIPSGRWYNFYTNETQKGSWQKMTVYPNSSIPLFVRGGTIFPTQDPANNTHFSRMNPFRVLVYLDNDNEDGKASGQLFWDDGVSIDTYENGIHYFAIMSCTKDEFSLLVQHNGIQAITNDLYLESVEVVGTSTVPVEVSLGSGTIISKSSFDYFPNVKRLVVRDLNHRMSDNLVIKWRSSPSPTNEEKLRVVCAPEGNASETTCQSKGCIWNETQSVNVPPCYLNSSSYGYKFVSVENTSATQQTLNLQHLPGASMFGNDSEQVVIHLYFLSDWLLRIKISPVSDDPVYEVPIALNLPDPAGFNSKLYNVDYESTGQRPFNLKVTRTNNKIVWDTSIGGLTISRQFLQLVTLLPTTYVYGLGESSHGSFRRKFDFETVAMFARDQPPGDPKANLYGVHPYYVCVDDTTTGSAHGVLLYNSNAMEVVLGPAPSITYRTVGGLLDFYFIFGDNSEMVTARYTQLIGRPYLPPYWALGFQLSRYGYNKLSAMEAARRRTLDAGIPLDVQYGDIDHMDNAKDFTYDMVNFSELPKYVETLHQNGMRFIIILDPAIVGIDNTYWPFTDGLKEDVFIRWPVETNHPDFQRFNSTYLYGYVWPPGEAVFPDFFKPETKNWWKSCIRKHHPTISFDGLWIDMNEAANFGTNEEKPFNWPENKEPWSLKCPVGPLDDPPYKPHAIWGPRLSDKTICLVGLQTDGIRNFTQYDIHNIYGWSQTMPTLEAVREVTGQRSIVITRSTFIGSGSMAGHWLGDNASKWPHMHQSIIGCLDFSLFGIPYIGADICGYFDNATSDLCERWTQLGAFYTFARNHNGLGYVEQDPAAFGPVVADSAKFIIDIRYSLLPYLYTLFYRAHVDGTTVIRPLFHEFPLDISAYDVDRQFLWGSALLVTPVLDQDQMVVCGFLPTARWFSLFDGMEEKQTGAIACFDAPNNRIPLHIRGGQIVVTQEPDTNTDHSRQNPFGVIVAPDATNSSTGELFWDDGLSNDTLSNNQFYLFHYSFNLVSGKNWTVCSNVTSMASSSFVLPHLSSIRVFGAVNAPTVAVTVVNGVESSIESIFYDSQTQELFLYNLTLPMTSNWSAIWWS